MMPYIAGALVAGWLFVLAADTLAESRQHKNRCSLDNTDDVLTRAKEATDRVDDLMRQMGAQV